MHPLVQLQRDAIFRAKSLTSGAMPNDSYSPSPSQGSWNTTPSRTWLLVLSLGALQKHSLGLHPMRYIFDLTQRRP